MRELEWLGEPAARALVAQLEQFTNRSAGALQVANGQPVPNLSLFVRIAFLLGTIAVAGAAFFATAFLLRIEELDDLAALVRRKLGRKRAAD